MNSLVRIFLRFYKNSLYRNSFWLMSGAFMMAGVGFFYWLIAAHLYTATQVGLAATFLSVAAVVNLIAMFGFSTTLLRYLPISKPKAKEKKINTAFTIVSLAALITGIIFMIGIPIWATKLTFLTSSLPIIFLVALFFPFNILNTITDSVFTAYREAQWVFVSNTFQSICKLIFLILLPALGVWGIIGSNIIAVVTTVILCCFMIAYFFKLRFKTLIDMETIHEVKKYSIGNYLSGLIGGLPALLLPIIITTRLSPEQTAYFYMPNMISMLLTIVPTMVSRAYLSEASHTNKAESVVKPLLFSYAILLPITGVTVLLGKNILNLFGHDYANGGYIYLVLISISVLISVANYFLGARLLVEHRLTLSVIVNMIGSITFLALAWLLIPNGIVGVGIAAIISQALSSFFFLFSKS